MTQQTMTLYDEDGNPVEVPIQQQAPPSDPESQHTPQEWAALRQEKRGRKEAEERAAALERREAIREAGVDLSTPLGKFFAEKYDGEPTVEAVTAAAKAAGFVEVPDTPGAAPDVLAQANQQAGDRIDQASPGSGIVDPLPKTATLDEAYLAGGTDAMLQAAREMGIQVKDAQ